MNIPMIGHHVFCTYSQRETFTRVEGKAFFCGDCGATDHEGVTCTNCAQPIRFDWSYGGWILTDHAPIDLPLVFCFDENSDTTHTPEVKA